MAISSLPSAYTENALRTDASWSLTALHQMAHASVSTSSVDVRLGKFGLSYSRQDISYTDPAPQASTPPHFQHELELHRLTQHVSPFRPAGSYTQAPSLQRRGHLAYTHQAMQIRTITPMISVRV
ncbi:hypothetical protein MASR1M90_16110 [Desulfovibrionales bacterium]